MLHRTRHLFIRQQTAVINSIRAHIAEFGIVAPVGAQRGWQMRLVYGRTICATGAYRATATLRGVPVIFRRASRVSARRHKSLARNGKT